MSRLLWDETGERLIETGIDRGVIYLPGVPPMPASIGYAWSGLTGIQETSLGGETEAFYHDGVKYLDWVQNEDYQAVLDAMSYPPEFEACDGRRAIAPGVIVTRQRRKRFDFCYRTLIGNDLVGLEHGYKLNLVWNCTAAPTTRNHQTLSENVTPSVFQWTLNSVPPPSMVFKPTSHMVIDSTHIPPEVLQTIEDILYGTPSQFPSMPSQQQIVDILQTESLLYEPLGPLI